MLNQILTYGGIGLGIVFLILFIVAITGDRKRVVSILGPVGLALVGIVVALGLRKGGDEDLEKIREENDRIRKELETTKAERLAIETDLARIKSEYETKITDLTTQIKAKDKELAEALDKVVDTAEKTPEEWLAGLPPEKKAELLKSIRDEIDFG